MFIRFNDSHSPKKAALASFITALVWGLPIQHLSAQGTASSAGMSTTSTPSGGKAAQPDNAHAANSRIETVTVIGTKSNLMSAQAIKRDADTMVDAISAEDIRVLDDRSVLDAMQRLPGVALERFADTNDPDHFGVEASGVIIRGMNQSRSEFNGRDSFTANAGRGLSYEDVPPELMGSIEIYKNQTADMIEGGIGGTVTLQTRKPFDSEKRILAFSVDVSQGDLADELSPSFSGLYSDRTATPLGEFGVLLNYAKSTVYGESHGIQSDAFMQFYAADLVTEGNPGAEGTRAQDFLGDDGQGTVWIPNAANVLMKEDARKREGVAAALQYQNVDETLIATAEYIRSDASLAWHERAIKYQGGFFTLDTRQTRVLDGTHFTFDDNGLFVAGTLTNGRDTFRVAQSGTNRVPKGIPLIREFPQWGHKVQMDSRVNDTTSLVEDMSFNLQWSPSQTLELSGDFQYIQAESSVDDLAIHINTWAHMQYDVRGSIPSLTYIEPWNGVRDATRAKEGDGNIWDASEDGIPAWPGFGGDPAGDQNYFQDPNSYYWRSAMDHYERSEGESVAARVDGSYHFERGLVTSITAGLRVAERQQVVRATSWNWGALAPEWQGQASDWDLEKGEIMGSGIGWLTDIESQQDGYEYVDWSNFMRGGVLAVPGDQTIHANEQLVRSVMGKHPSRVLLQSPVTGNWEPYPTRPGLDAEYGMFKPGEINTTIETTNAAYLRLDFGGNDELTYSGNIGLRYLTTERVAVGAVEFPHLAPVQRPTVRPVPEGIALPLNPQGVDAYLHQQVADGKYADFGAAANSLENNWIKNPYNYLSAEERDFTLAVQDAEGQYQPVEDVVWANVDYDVLLPSFNIKVDLTSRLVGRFAMAKAIAFPDMGDVRNRIEFEEIEFSDILVEERTVVTDSGRNIYLIENATLGAQEGDLLWVGGGGNPYIRPMESIQYDFSLEWYFSDVGQLSAAIFHKNLDHYFTQGVITREFTHPLTQSTQDTAVTTTRNGGKAKLDGLELTYHQFFGGIFDGFGVLATYTHIDANSVPNNEQDVADEQWFESIYEDTGIRVNFDKLPLEGQSENTVNLMGMFENDIWSARLAYNWRSKYLLTTRDVISKAPLWYDDHGELDGSLFYHISDNFTVGLQATNITNARSDIIMILNDDLLSTGRSWFVSDRRFALVFRGEL